MERIKLELSKLESEGQLRRIPNIISKAGSKLLLDGQEYVNLASNDYLGISTNKILQEEFINEYKDCMPLFSSASARLLTGTSSEYANLESTLSALFNKDACLIYNTGYQCNLGVITALIGRGDVVFSDKLNHASIIDGMKLSDGEFYRYNHCDYEHLEKILSEKRGKYNRALIVSESIFSMDGDAADIHKLIELKQKYNCLLMIDEAHAFFTSEKHATGYSYRQDVDIITATFGKAIGSFGAFCVANEDIIAYLTNKSRSFIFSTSIPAFNIAWTNWLLTSRRGFLDAQRNKLLKLVEETHNYLVGIEVKTPSVSQIIPIIIGDNQKTLAISEELRAKGYYIPAIRPPTVREGSSRLRLSLTANSRFEDIKAVLDTI